MKPANLEVARMVLAALLAAGIVAAVAGCARDGSSASDRPQSRAVDSSPQCVRETGTRLPTDRTCEPGRSYSRDEIDRTGATGTGEAVRELGP